MSLLLRFWHSPNLKNPANEMIITTLIRMFLRLQFSFKYSTARRNCSTVKANFFWGLWLKIRLTASKTCFIIKLPLKFTFIKEWKYLIAETAASIAVKDLPFWNEATIKRIIYCSFVGSGLISRKLLHQSCHCLKYPLYFFIVRGALDLEIILGRHDTISFNDLSSTSNCDSITRDNRSSKR